MFLYIICILFLFIYYLLEIWERSLNKKCPPGPWPIPVLGCVLQMGLAAPEPHQAFREMSKRYGEIYRLRIGPSKEFVIVSSLEGIREIFSNDATAGRDITDSPMSDRQMGRNLGVILSEGHHWEVMRSWSVRQLRDQGFGKSAPMDKLIKGQLAALFERIDAGAAANNTGSKIQVNELFEKYVLRIFWRMLVGDLIGVQDEEEMMDNLILKSRKMAASGVLGAGLLNIFPFLKHLMPKLTGYTDLMDFNNYSMRISKELLQDRIKDIKESRTFRETEGMLDAFAEKMIKGEQPEFFFEDNWSLLFMDYLQASVETSSAFLESIFLFLVLYPDVQERVYGELQKVVPEEEEIFYSHFKKMPYLQAVYYEVHRHAKLAPHLVPRKTLADLDYKGYTIKKGTTLMADLASAYADPKLWDDPETFRPERFLDKASGMVINEERIIPFGIGKRMCPGNGFADNTSFLIVTGILRKYRLRVVPGTQRPREDMHVTYTAKPYPFQAIFERRH